MENHKMEGAPENDGFVEYEEDDEVDIDDEFEDIEEEEFDENNDSGFKWHGCIGWNDLHFNSLFIMKSSPIGIAHSKIQ